MPDRGLKQDGREKKLRLRPSSFFCDARTAEGGDKKESLLSVMSAELRPSCHGETRAFRPGSWAVRRGNKHWGQHDNVHAQAAIGRHLQSECFETPGPQQSKMW